MLRQLLTLLAVISGFALVAEPVHAAQGGIVTLQAVGDSVECRTITTAPLQGTGLLISDVLSDRPCRKPPVVIAAPPVMLQADRARE